MTENNNLVLKKISNLSNLNFFIPSFQRGYRWDIMQVEDLLNDIKEYIDMENKESFLCLQPIVVYEKEGKYVVIDGQQRLTTIAIIKYYLSKHDKQLKQFDYNIEYEKYGKSLSCLLKPYDEENLSSNIHDKVKDILGKNTHSLDEYHIILSYLTIARYFNELELEDKYVKDFKELVSSTDGNNSIQFIWYNVTDEINNDEKKAIEIFTRLNIGKIPLTDAELIKALFLKKDNFKESEIDKKLHIAYKWDEIEKTLNNDTFWYFISNKNENEFEKRNRIELILELAIDKNNGKNHELFKEYENKLKENNKFNELWQQIEECFMTLKEWYNDNELYHYIGFLTCSKTCIKDIYKNKDNDNKKHIDNIKQMINNVLKIDSQQNTANFINQFNYSNNIISTILLFSNIYTTIKMNMKKNSKEDTNNNLLNRFPFDLYVKESWDIEHIAPQTENPLNTKTERIEWFWQSYNYLGDVVFNENEILNKFIEENNIDVNIKDEIQNLTNDIIPNIKEITKKNMDKKNNHDYSSIDSNVFKDNWDIIYRYILYLAEYMGKNINLGEEEHKVGNLVLLPRDINRSYKNALFGVKRKHIIDDEKNNRFIPIETKHVFLKYYSNNTNDLWIMDDAIEYKKIISSNIEHILKLK